MRVWSLHPRLLDRAALVACWRETLLAQKVLDGGTRGYRNHPQLVRWKACESPLDAIGAYLTGLQEEAIARGYNFDLTRVQRPGMADGLLTVTTGQLELEAAHLRAKVIARAPEEIRRLSSCFGGTVDWSVLAHPVFCVTDGGVASWERAVTS